MFTVNATIQRLIRLAPLSLGCSIALTLLQFPGLAQITRATIADIVGGDRVYIEQTQAYIRDLAEFGEEVSTEDTRAQLDFDNGAAGRLQRFSNVQIGQCVEVQDGTLVASGPVDGCVSGFLVRVEGTIFTIDRATNTATSDIKTLEGQVELVTQNNPNPSNPVLIPAGQKVSVRPGQPLSSIVPQPMTKGEYCSIIRGDLFQGFRNPLPNEDRLEEVVVRLYGSPCDTFPVIW